MKMISQVSTTSAIARLCLMTLLFSNALSLQDAEVSCWDETYDAGGPYEADLFSVLEEVIKKTCNQGQMGSYAGQYVVADAYSTFEDVADCFDCMDEANIVERCPLRIGGFVTMARCSMTYSPI